VNGRIAPFLELGVGFNPELTAEDNVRLYGAIMGMSKSEMEEKFEERRLYLCRNLTKCKKYHDDNSEFRDKINCSGSRASFDNGNCQEI
ncbi:MAG: hypothetical protein OIN87_14140, partial [Candidatus Methanoperedens sp.]|nr:hypothetical protein [Candidatus Methanoperedens sp.]